MNSGGFLGVVAYNIYMYDNIKRRETDRSEMTLQ